jgi:hypothetical protein
MNMLLGIEGLLCLQTEIMNITKLSIMKTRLMIFAHTTLNHLRRRGDFICHVGLTLENSTFCPHSVFMCFVWISEQTAIISLYNIN